MMFQAAAQPVMPALELPKMFSLDFLDISSEFKISDVEKVYGKEGIHLKEKLLDPLFSGFTTRQTLAQALHVAAMTRWAALPSR
jgi:hypothetical protein